MSILNDRIKEKRLERGMTLLEVAEVLGVKEATMQRYESGDIKNIKHETISILANTFGCSPAYLMGWTDIASVTEDADGNVTIDPIYKKDEKKLLREFQKLNDIGRQKAIERVSEITEISRYTKSTDKLTAEDFPECNHLTPIAAHNDDADDEEQQRLMQQDIDEL
jgi:transcriptional regulator with XRE-family HTH domain